MELPDMAAAVVEPLATVATTAIKADMAAQESGEHDVHGIKLSVWLEVLYHLPDRKSTSHI